MLNIKISISNDISGEHGQELGNVNSVNTSTKASKHNISTKHKNAQFRQLSKRASEVDSHLNLVNLNKRQILVLPSVHTDMNSRRSCKKERPSFMTNRRFTHKRNQNIANCSMFEDNYKMFSSKDSKSDIKEPRHSTSILKSSLNIDKLAKIISGRDNQNSKSPQLSKFSEMSSSKLKLLEKSLNKAGKIKISSEFINKLNTINKNTKIIEEAIDQYQDLTECKKGKDSTKIEEILTDKCISEASTYHLFLAPKELEKFRKTKLDTSLLVLKLGKVPIWMPNKLNIPNKSILEETQK